jgi:hypothetical protein
MTAGRFPPWIFFYTVVPGAIRLEGSAAELVSRALGPGQRLSITATGLANMVTAFVVHHRFRGRAVGFEATLRDPEDHHD